MRIRSVKPEFFKDSITGSLSDGVQILLIGLYLLADKAGLIEGDLAVIHFELFPHRINEVTKRHLAQRIKRLIEVGLIAEIDCDYTCYPNDKVRKRGFIYRVIGFGSLHVTNDKERLKIKIYKVHKVDAQRGSQGYWSLDLGPGSLDPGHGYLDFGASSDARGDSPPVAPDGSPSGRAPSESEAKNPPIAATPPPADEPPPWNGPAEIRPGETWGQAVARELREGK